MAALTVPTVFTAVDKLSSVISKMQEGVGKFATDTQKKYAAMSRSAQAFSSNARQVAMSSGIAGAAIVAPLVLATKAAADFQDQMATIGTTVGKVNVSLLSKGVLETLKNTSAPLKELTDGLYKITSAGVPASKAIDVLNQSAKLALIGRGTVPEAADALTSAMNVFKDQGLSSNKIMSMLFQTIATGKTTISGMSESFGATANIIHNGGVKLGDFLAAVKAMTIMGEPASQAMNQVRASVFSLEKPTKRMQIIFSQLGVKDIHSLINKFGDLGGAMAAIEASGKKHGNNLAMAWGKVGSFAAVVNLTSPTGQSSYKQGQLAMANSEQAAAAAYALKMQTLTQQLKKAQNNMQAFAISAGTTLIPMLTKLLPSISAVLDRMSKWVENNKPLIGSILKWTGIIGGLLLVLSPLAFTIGLIADAMKIYAGVQLYFATNTAKAAAALVVETGAIGGLNTAAVPLAGTFAAAESAATGFLGVLSAWVMPASILALVGWQAWKGIKESTHHDESAWDYADRLKHPYSKVEDYIRQYNKNHPNIPVTPGWTPFNSGATNKKEKYDILPDQTTSKIDSLIKVRDESAPQTGTLNVNFNDPKGIIKNTFTEGGIPVKVTSTTGNK